MALKIHFKSGFWIVNIVGEIIDISPDRSKALIGSIADSKTISVGKQPQYFDRKKGKPAIYLDFITEIEG